MIAYFNRTGKDKVIYTPGGHSVTLHNGECVSGEWFAKYASLSVEECEDGSVQPKKHCDDPRAGKIARALLADPTLAAKVEEKQEQVKAVRAAKARKAKAIKAALTEPAKPVEAKS